MNREYLFEILLKGYKNIRNGYIYYAYKKKNYKRSRILYQIFHNTILSKDDIIHHIDKDKQNDHIPNLKLMTVEEHTSLHFAGKRS